MNVLFTICGRAGSKGYKNKNLRKLNDVPLVYYTLAAIRLYQESHPAVQALIALNTDSADLKEIVKTGVGNNPFTVVDRKKQLADDVTPKVAVIRDTLLQCEGETSFDIVVDLDITSPLRRLCDIETAIEKTLSDVNCDLTYSVVRARRNPYFNMVEERDGIFQKVCRSDFTARQQAPDIYEMNASIYAYRPTFLRGNIDRSIIDYRCNIVIMPDYLVLDIDSEEDLQLMEECVRIFKKRDPALRCIAEKAQMISDGAKARNE